MRVVALPGVFAPISDSRLLANCAVPHAPHARVLEPCCGSGYVAVRLALAGAGAVTAIDVSRRAVRSARLTPGATACGSGRCGAICSLPCAASATT